MSRFDWKELLDHLIVVEGECMEENYGAGRAANDMDEECNAGIREAYAALVNVQPVLLAAPDLMEALRSALDRWDDEDEGDAPSLGAAMRAALAKAEGRTDVNEQ